MNPRQWLELLALAALWGGSFLFMRIAAPEFGAVALVFLRVGLGALLLLPLALWQGHGTALKTHWRGIGMVGIVNSGLPFLAFAFAALSLAAGLSAIFNSTAPLWGALIAWWVWREAPSSKQIWGLALGFVGVLGLAGHKAGLRVEESSWEVPLAVLACIAATAGYGLGANLTKRRLTGVPPMAVAAGSQLAATVLCLPMLPWAWPKSMPSVDAWAATIGLGLLCTGVAYVLYFRLIAQVGPAKAITVTYLIPLFGAALGYLVLKEEITLSMVIGGALIVAGTMLATRR